MMQPIQLIKSKYQKHKPLYNLKRWYPVFSTDALSSTSDQRMDILKQVIEAGGKVY